MAMLADGRPGWRHALLLGAKIVFSLGLLMFLIGRVDLREVVHAIRLSDPRVLLTAALVMLASNVLGSYQWGRLLREVDIRIPFWKVCAYYHVGLFFNNFLPANVGGDIARVVDASRYARTRGAAISTVLLDRMIGTVALGGLALLTTLPAIDRFHLTLAYLALVAFFALAVTLLWAVFHPAWLELTERLLGAVGLGRLKPHLDELSQRLGGFRGQRRLFIELLAVAAVVQLARIFVHVLVARALGLHVPVTYFFLFVPLLAVIVSLPISLNGIGVREGAGVVLFGLVGVSRAHAFTLQFSTYLVALAVSLLGGIVFLIRIPRRRAGTRPPGRPSDV